MIRSSARMAHERHATSSSFALSTKVNSLFRFFRMYGGRSSEMNMASSRKYYVYTFPVQVYVTNGRFEAGTPTIAEVIGLGAAINYMSNIGIQRIHEYEEGWLKLMHLLSRSASVWH